MQQAGTGDGEATERARRSALVVEDSDAIRALLRTILEEESIAVVEARDGAEGLDCLRADPAIGLVFLDMNMPGMNGLDMLKSIRAELGLLDLPVVVLTGALPSGALTTQLNAAGWLQKPVRHDAVAKVARRYLLQDGAPARRTP